jgi:hypothetical protein
MQSNAPMANPQVLLDQAEAKLQAAYQTIDEVLKVNLELKAHIITLQKNFQNVVKQQSDNIVKLTDEKKELEDKLKTHILDNTEVVEPIY